MARTKEISMSLHRKISDGDYGSVGFEVEETVSLEDGDSASEEFKNLYNRLKRRGDQLFTKICEPVRK